MGERQVTFSAAGGLLRVWNPTPVNAKVFVGEKEAIVSPGCTKEFALADGEQFAIANAAPRRIQDAPLTPPPNPPAPDLVESVKQGIADAAAAAGIVDIPMGVPDPNLLMGSMKQPTTFLDLAVPRGRDPLLAPLETVIRTAPAGAELDPSMCHMQLADLVDAAYDISGCSIAEWNALTETDREQAIEETLELLRAAAAANDVIAKRVPPVPGAHHELSLEDVTATKDRMGAPLPEGQVRGRRVRDTDRFAPGDYGQHPVSGEWMANAPGGGLGNLSAHEVTEHEDGTISVSPSILITGADENGPTRWHGFLERGIWRTA
jgi:hypothetical protein